MLADADGESAWFGCRVLGENNKNLGKIVAVLAKCIGKGSGGKDSLVDSETWRNIVTLLQQMNGSLPAQVTSSFYLCCWLLRLGGHGILKL